MFPSTTNLKAIQLPLKYKQGKEMNEHTNTLDAIKDHADKAKVAANVKVGEHEVSYTKGEAEKDQRHPSEQAKDAAPGTPGHLPL